MWLSFEMLQVGRFNYDKGIKTLVIEKLDFCHEIIIFIRSATKIDIFDYLVLN